MGRNMVSVYFNLNNSQERALFEELSVEGVKKGTELKRLALETFTSANLSDIQTQLVQDVTASVIRALVPVMQGLLAGITATENGPSLPPRSSSGETKRRATPDQLKGHLID